MAFVNSLVSAPRRSTFAGAALRARVPVGVSTLRMGSDSIPFLPSPKTLDPEAPGFADFDPLNISGIVNLKFLQESEIKHGRICMLAALGWIFPEIWHLPSGVFSETSPLAAVRTVPLLGLAQIVLLVAVLEAISFDKIYYQDGWEPGAYGFDPLAIGRTTKNYKRMQTAEIKNGRLAMIAVGGFIHQNLLTNQGILEQLSTRNFAPTRFPIN